MSRSAPSEVKAIIDTSLSDPTIQIWIDVANVIVDDHLDCIDKDEVILKQIETNLSAHFVSMIDSDGTGKTVEKDKAEDLETEYTKQKMIDEEINTTVYGRAANALSGGCLAKYDKPKTFLVAI